MITYISLEDVAERELAILARIKDLEAEKLAVEREALLIGSMYDQLKTAATSNRESLDELLAAIDKALTA